MKKKRFIYYLIYFSLVVNSCGWIFGYKDLGDGYYFFDKDKFPDIIFSSVGGWSGSGSVIVPHKVIQVNFNNYYIIALNVDLKTKNKNYWIIDKFKLKSIEECKASEDFGKALRSNVSGPLDSTNFYIQLNLRKIDLRFKWKESGHTQ